MDELELEEMLWRMTLPDPSLPNENFRETEVILYHYPVLIEYLQNSVRPLQYGPYL